MNGNWLMGAAVGVGVGWLNVTALSIAPWMNMALIFLLAIAGGLELAGKRDSTSAFGGERNA